MLTDELVASARDLLDDLRLSGLKLVTAESCTGGLIAALLTEIPGSSDVLERGFVTYSNDAKVDAIGVPRELIEQFGAVSREVAEAMAKGALAHSKADVAIAVTGVAGPGGGTQRKARRPCLSFGASPRTRSNHARAPFWCTFAQRHTIGGGWRSAEPRPSGHLMKRTLLVAAAFLSWQNPSLAADFTARQLTGQLYAAPAGSVPDFSAKDLSGLDLAGLNFKKANLTRAHLFGADLSGADLSGSNLSGALLDRVVLISTRLDNANLEGASLLRPSAFSTLAAVGSEAPSFRSANMRAIRMFGRFNRADFSGADLTGATCAPFGKTGFIEEIWRTELLGANFSGATLSGANLTQALLRFANLKAANLQGAILKDADLSGADLTGADVTDADFTGTDLDGANLTGAKGLDRVKGLHLARNASKMIR